MTRQRLNADGAPPRGRLAAVLATAALLAACTLDEANFSQHPGFARYLEARPPSDAPPSARERRWLEAFRPRFHVPPAETGPISFYDDYIAEGSLYDGSGEHVSSRVDRERLNAYRDDPGAVFVHEGKADGGTPVVPAHVDRDTLRLPGTAEPVAAIFLTYHLVFRRSGIGTGIPGWQRTLLDWVGDADDWHQLDHYAAVTLTLVPRNGADPATAAPADLIPVAATMQQHNYMRTYVLVDAPAAADHPGRIALDGDGRVAVDVAEASHALFPHAPGRRTHRAVRFLDGDTAPYLLRGEDPPWISGDDVTDPARQVDYTLAFLPPDDAFYMFRGWLGERRRLPGRDGPPGAFYNTLPPLQPHRVQLAVFFWHEGAEGYAADLAALDLDTWRPPDADDLAPFHQRLVRALPCRDDWALPCRSP
ncbi:hypothetical protein QWY84_17895 [Aquisalimonas lutea]|uniref:hypothetical protein n=1 Tax=Aquisalimonas lutea TaxID=1327750 RepID=UPI0025B2B6E0|nr:hypothetical protein [Aquisalimonas lutea]MDN3519483.1 hypothetical protein [Aquisalimonas lutea]